MTDWDDFRVFRRVMHRRGYASAANDLGCTPVTARRAVERLADRIGAALFVRAPDGLAPTAAAEHLAPVVAQMADLAGAFSRLASAGTEGVEGRVKIAVLGEELLAFELMTPIFRELHDKHRALTLELGLNVDWDRFRSGAAEVAVRATGGDQPPVGADLEPRRAARLSSGLFASRRYLEFAGAPTGIKDLTRFSMVLSATPARGQWILDVLGVDRDSLDVAFACDDRMAQFMAIREGLGIGYCYDAVAAIDSDLTPVLPQFKLIRDLWVVIKRSDSDIDRVVAVRDALAERLGRHGI
jgi:DNA-binding transcriptional LysR family regulator